jgi:hypothetical protein
MTEDFRIEDVKPGDMLTAHDTWHTLQGNAPIAHKWIVLNNNNEGFTEEGHVEVYVLYSQAPHEERHSFYYTSFNGQTYQRMSWSLEHGEP